MVPAPDRHPAYAVDAESGDPLFAYKPRFMAPLNEFRLRPDGLEWRVGRHAERVAYDHIHRLRLSFRPMQLQTAGYRAEIWPQTGRKIQIGSWSWKSLAEQERLGPAYRDFIVELHRRVVAAGGAGSFETGTSPLRFWPGLVTFVATSLGIAALAVVALADGEIAGAGFVAAFLALFLWRMGAYFGANRPGSYRPDAVPARLLPRE